MTFEEFRNKIKNTSGTRVHKITNSVSIRSIYRYIRKNKWLGISRAITEHEFCSIIRKVNSYLVDELLAGKDIILPQKMGKLELRKYSTKVSFEDGKVKTNMPINWNATIKLWYDDEEAYNNRTLIRMIEPEVYSVHYSKYRANFNNKAYYEFSTNRALKLKLKDNIKNNKLDAFNYEMG